MFRNSPKPLSQMSAYLKFDEALGRDISGILGSLFHLFFFILNTLDAPEDTEDETLGVPSFRPALNNKLPFVIYISILRRPNVAEGCKFILFRSKSVS